MLVLVNIAMEDIILTLLNMVINISMRQITGMFHGVGINCI